MFYVIVSRGYIREADKGSNESYYLYSGEIYRMVSPNDFFFYDQANVINLYDDGGIRGIKVFYEDGGVQDFK